MEYKTERRKEEEEEEEKRESRARPEWCSDPFPGFYGAQRTRLGFPSFFTLLCSALLFFCLFLFSFLLVFLIPQTKTCWNWILFHLFSFSLSFYAHRLPLPFAWDFWKRMASSHIKRGEREEEEALGLDDFVCRVAPCSPLLLLLLLMKKVWKWDVNNHNKNGAAAAGAGAAETVDRSNCIRATHPTLPPPYW